jgi:branched-chain amino acid transport system ATP-binding protein
LNEPLLKIEGLSHHFAGLKAVDNVSLSLGRGEIIGLIGSNGAGKTTLVNLVTGHLKPKEGRVRFAGRDITGLPPFKLQRLGIVRTFQVVQPFNELTSRENVAASAFFSGHSGDLAGARRTADATLERLGIAYISGKYPPHLTLAERKRLELAKALAAKPQLIFLDEVNAGLNGSEINDVLVMLRSIAEEGMTIVVIEHLMRVVRGLCRRLVVLHQGRLLADGPTDEVAANPNVLSAYLGARGAAMLGRVS